MKQIDLGNTKTVLFDKFLVLALSKKWLTLNDENPLEFEVKLKDGQLILSAKLVAQLERTKGVVKNVI